MNIKDNVFCVSFSVVVIGFLVFLSLLTGCSNNQIESTACKIIKPIEYIEIEKECNCSCPDCYEEIHNAIKDYKELEGMFNE